MSGYVRASIQVVDPTMSPQLAAAVLDATAQGRDFERVFLVDLDAPRANELTEILEALASSQDVSSNMGRACGAAAELLRSRALGFWGEGFETLGISLEG